MVVIKFTQKFIFHKKLHNILFNVNAIVENS
jgi:hypothetical protein